MAVVANPAEAISVAAAAQAAAQAAADVALPQDCIEVILRNLRVIHVHSMRTINADWRAAARSRQDSAAAMAHSSFARFLRRYRALDVRREAYGQCLCCGMVGYDSELPRCRACESVHYCSLECQQADSRRHGYRCRMMSGIWF